MRVVLKKFPTGKGMSGTDPSTSRKTLMFQNRPEVRQGGSGSAGEIYIYIYLSNHLSTYYQHIYLLINNNNTLTSEQHLAYQKNINK